MSDEYTNGLIDGYGVGFIQGTHEGFIMGRGQQAKETREKLGSMFGEGLQHMKSLKKSELRGENISIRNEEKFKTILKHVKIKDKV